VGERWQHPAALARQLRLAQASGAI
jgi:hypothetical protein